MKKNYLNLEFMAGATIDECVEELKIYSEKGIRASGTFNGISLYSDEDDLDTAYKKITGKTKEEFSLISCPATKSYISNFDLLTFEEKVEYWQQEGKKYIDESKLEYWNRIVPIRLNDLYEGMELGCCLDIIKVLNKGTLEDAEAIIKDQGHSGISYALVSAMIREFSDKGKDFTDFLDK